MAMAYENGTEMIKAKNEVSKVPSKNGNAPYISLTGSQVLPHKYFMPSAFSEGIECISRVRKIPSAIAIIAIEVMSSVLLKAASALTFLNEKKCLISIMSLDNYPLMG